jgi:hypothetical protein
LGRGRALHGQRYAREIEIYAGLVAIAAVIALAGYGLVSALADRLDPKLRA